MQVVNIGGWGRPWKLLFGGERRWHQVPSSNGRGGKNDFADATQSNTKKRNTKEDTPLTSDSYQGQGTHNITDKVCLLLNGL